MGRSYYYTYPQPHNQSLNPFIYKRPNNLLTVRFNIVRCLLPKASFFYFWANLKKVRLHFARLHSRAHKTFTVFEIHLRLPVVYYRGVQEHGEAGVAASPLHFGGMSTTQRANLTAWLKSMDAPGGPGLHAMFDQLDLNNDGQLCAAFSHPGQCRARP